MNGRLDIAKGVMRVVCSKAIQGRDKIKLDAHPPGFIDWPLKQVGFAIPDGVEGRQQIKRVLPLN